MEIIISGGRGVPSAPLVYYSLNNKEIKYIKCFTHKGNNRISVGSEKALCNDVLPPVELLVLEAAAPVSEGCWRTLGQ